MLRERGGWFQIGLGLFLLGLTVKIALYIGVFLNPLATLAIWAGAILMVVGLIVPRK